MKRIKTGGEFKCLSEGKQLPILLHVITGEGNMGDVKLGKENISSAIFKIDTLETSTTSWWWRL